MAEIKYSRAAIRDLEEIGDCIAETLQSPTAALSTAGEIQDTIDKLTDFPLIGAPLSFSAPMETAYRFLVCGNYLAFYHVEGDTVFVDRILYGRRDYIRILFGDLSED